MISSIHAIKFTGELSIQYRPEILSKTKKNQNKSVSNYSGGALSCALRVNALFPRLKREWRASPISIAYVYIYQRWHVSENLQNFTNCWAGTSILKERQFPFGKK
jgi:hypothetical protein